MAGAAGKYSTRFTWMQRSTSKDTTTGNDVEVFTSNGTLWGELVMSSGSEETDFGAVQGQVRATITLRQFPAVKAVDRLTETRFGQTWHIDGVSRDWAKNETTIEAHAFESLEV